MPLPIRSPDRINCYLLRSGNGDLLVDTGMRGSEQALEQGLAELDAHIRGVLVTHGHVDHWGLAARFSRTVLAHRCSRSQLEFTMNGDEGMADAVAGMPVDREFVRVFSRYRRLIEGVPEIQEVNDGDHLDGWRVLWTPGHAPGHICLYRREDGILIAGDHLLPGFTPNIQMGSERPDPVQDYMCSLRRVAQLDISLVLPAHGEPFVDAAARAAELIAHHEDRLGTLEQLLGEAPTSTARLTEGLFGDLERDEDRLLAEMETHAHLEHLRLRGRAVTASPGAWAAPAGVH